MNLFVASAKYYCMSKYYLGIRIVQNYFSLPLRPEEDSRPAFEMLLPEVFNVTEYVQGFIKAYYKYYLQVL
jgi:hypothetical protein